MALTWKSTWFIGCQLREWDLSDDSRIKMNATKILVNAKMMIWMKAKDARWKASYDQDGEDMRLS